MQSNTRLGLLKLMIFCCDATQTQILPSTNVVCDHTTPLTLCPRAATSGYPLIAGLKLPAPGVSAPEAKKAATAEACHAGWVATFEKPPPLVMSAALANEETTWGEQQKQK